MKKLLLPLLCFLAMLAPSDCGAAFDGLPYFGALRAEVYDQLTIASNNIAMDQDAAANRLLARRYRNALRTIDQTPGHSPMAGIQSLITLNLSLNRTNISDIFVPVLTQTAGRYVDYIVGIEAGLAERLADSYPTLRSRLALASLRRLTTALEGARALIGSSEPLDRASLIEALRLLERARSRLRTTARLIVRAENAARPANHVRAVITASNEGTFTYLPRLRFVEANYDPTNNLFTINVIQSRTVRGFVRARVLVIAVRPSGEGVSTYDLAGDDNDATVSYGVKKRPVGSPETVTYEEDYQADNDGEGTDTGDLVIYFDSASKTVFGYFAFRANGTTNALRRAQVTGEFIVNYP